MNGITNGRTTPPAAGGATDGTTFKAEVWADNWFSLYVNGVLVGEHSVPITTKRSFNLDRRGYCHNQ